MTPESKTKQQIKKLFKKYDQNIWPFMPVQSGYGAPALDFLLCASGTFIAIEAKAPGKGPTPRQILTIGEMREAGAAVFVIDGPGEEMDRLEKFLGLVCR